jgi:hypothetical protein
MGQRWVFWLENALAAAKDYATVQLMEELWGYVSVPLSVLRSETWMVTKKGQVSDRQMEIQSGHLWVHQLGKV